MLCEVIGEPVTRSAKLTGVPIKMTGKPALRITLAAHHRNTKAGESAMAPMSSAWISFQPHGSPAAATPGARRTYSSHGGSISTCAPACAAEGAPRGWARCPVPRGLAEPRGCEVEARRVPHCGQRIFCLLIGSPLSFANCLIGSPITWFFRCVRDRGSRGTLAGRAWAAPMLASAREPRVTQSASSEEASNPDKGN